ncbi:hypothetical protein [Aliiglaciecola sp. LCG003]|uniref:hypothetical protein n=1 Tax=Aliiglaciecola sp. LCG003 TaxID=3053655 RepID=UPI002573AFE5|nr:hypothetical protein [Aliiglaciecola sp. LCG003]WJG08096.1 hypothetical protein QR722_12150 [Aliiglaciecola sp. LCG003]
MKKFLVLTVILGFSTAGYAAGNMDKITNLNEFSYFTHTYYLHPQPELIENAIKFVDSSDVASNPNAKAPLLMSFSCLFSNYGASEREKWQEQIKSTGEPAKSILTQSINQSPLELLAATATSPAKNDMNWSCFFATGDFSYLNSIIEGLQHLDNREDMNLYLTAATAKWSLSSNAKRHVKVTTAMEAMKGGDVKAMQPVADEILNKDPQVIRAEMLAVLKEQKEKGVWK